MEVSGRKSFDTQGNILCKPCEDRNLCTRADGFCIDCEEHICKACFETHKQFKVCRGHTMANLDEALVKKDLKEELAKCDQHLNELIKFYCAQHEQVGCGDCMILGHKTCKVEYIRDKARKFKDSQEFENLVKGVDKCRRKAEEMLSSIKNNKIQVEDVNEKFTRDVNMFKEEIISNVKKLTDAMLKEGRCVKATDIKSMNMLETENEELINEISRLSEVFESQIDQPNKLFVSSILQKPKLNQLREQLNSIRNKNNIEVYEFKREGSLERSAKECKQLGSMQKVMQVKETDLQEEVRPKKTAQPVQVPEPPKPQPLLDRQLVCRNMIVDGECLSFAENGNGDAGLYVDKARIRDGSYFEVEILSTGQRGSIAIGVAPEDYPKNLQLGWGSFSIGYHADNGRLYHESKSGSQLGLKCHVGDRIGCRITLKGVTGVHSGCLAVFTRNGTMIGKKGTYTTPPRYPAIGMHSSGEKVKVILDAKMPEMCL